MTRQEEKSSCSFGSLDSPGKLTSTCQPVSPGLSGARKSHWKAAKVVARPPSSLTNETVESRMQDWRVCRRPERRLLVVTEPDERFSPRCRVVRIASGVPPQDGTARVGKLPRKGPINSDKPVFNEVLYLCVAKRTRRFMIVGRQEYPLIACGQPPSPCDARLVRLIWFGKRGAAQAVAPGSSATRSTRQRR